MLVIISDFLQKYRVEAGCRERYEAAAGRLNSITGSKDSVILIIIIHSQVKALH